MRRLLPLLLLGLLAACTAPSTSTPDTTATDSPTEIASASTAAPTVIPPSVTSLPTWTVAAPSNTPPLVSSSDLPTLDEIGPEWTMLEPGGDTVCALDTPYAFWARQGTSGRLMVYFQPGGGCWDVETCSANSGWYDWNVTSADNPRGADGILDLDNPENPFADDSIVYIPVCTGDVHMGGNTQTYTDDSESLTVNHTGFVNAAAALEWAYANIPDPDSVFVTGCSAGSPGSIMHTPYIIEQYPGIPVRQLGDSLAFVFGRPLDLQEDSRTHDNFAPWIPELGAIQPGEFLTSDFYAAIANHYPEHSFAQTNSLNDWVQIRYYVAIDGEEENWPRDLTASLDSISARADNFRSYVVGGSEHCALQRSLFYRYAANGVSMRDWVAAYAAGEAVDSVRCAECDQPEYITP